jgi:hypothetical protein
MTLPVSQARNVNALITWQFESPYGAKNSAAMHPWRTMWLLVQCNVNIDTLSTGADQDLHKLYKESSTIDILARIVVQNLKDMGS